MQQVLLPDHKYDLLIDVSPLAPLETDDAREEYVTDEDEDEDEEGVEEAAAGGAEAAVEQQKAKEERTKVTNVQGGAATGRLDEQPDALEGEEGEEDDRLTVCGRDGCTLPAWHKGICMSLVNTDAGMQAPDGEELNGTSRRSSRRSIPTRKPEPEPEPLHPNSSSPASGSKGRRGRRDGAAGKELTVGPSKHEKKYLRWAYAMLTASRCSDYP